MPDISLRALKEADMPFIIETWLKGAYFGSWMRDIDFKTYYKYYPAVVQDILRRNALNARIACLSDDPDTILGYVVLEPSQRLAHFAFVKKAWRGNGIFNALVEGANIAEVTHLTKPGRAIARKKGWTFNPFLA